MRRFLAVATLSLPMIGLPVMVGCEREIEHKKTVETNSDGSSTVKEKKVTENPDGSVTKTESKDVQK